MLDLIERLEKAMGPDGNLDREIATACGIAWSSDEEGQFGGYDIMPRRVRFTASMDAALLLMPKRSMLYWVVWDSLGSYASRAAISGGGWIDDSELGGASGAPTPAIALCIAALRARAALNIQHREGET